MSNGLTDRVEGLMYRGGSHHRVFAIPETIQYLLWTVFVQQNKCDKTTIQTWHWQGVDKTSNSRVLSFSNILDKIVKVALPAPLVYVPCLITICVKVASAFRWKSQQVCKPYTNKPCAESLGIVFCKRQNLTEDKLVFNLRYYARCFLN